MYGPFYGEALAGTHKPRFREILAVTRGYLNGTYTYSDLWDVTRLRKQAGWDAVNRRVDYCRFIDGITAKG